MALTEEQKERIRINKERALEKKRQKAEERAKADAEAKTAAQSEAEAEGQVIENIEKREDKSAENGSEELLSTELEDFEVGASEYVTRDEAMRKYCLPPGTLAVCATTERPNPRNKAWKPMKLYTRAEIRRRARERFGGLDGLIEERRKRERKRLANDMEGVKDVFKRSKS